MTAWEKREQWKQNARSNSGGGGGGGRPARGPQRVPPRRHHSTDGLDLMREEANDMHSPGKPESRRRLPPGEDADRRGPPARTRSSRNRRASIDTGSGHIRNDDDDEQHAADSGKPPIRSKRRSSLGYTQSDGSMDPTVSSRSLQRGPPSQRGPPQRHKSSAGTSMDPRTGQSRRLRTARRGEGSSSNLGGLYGDSGHPPPPPDDDDDDDDDAGGTTPGGSRKERWAKDRNRNQEMIMSMYKDSAKKKDQHHHNVGSSSDLNVDMENLDLSQEIVAPALESSGGGEKDKKRRSALSKLKKMHKKKDLKSEEEDPDHPPVPVDSRNMAGRTRGSLLERVGAVDEHSDRPSSSLQKGGSTAYSDRILSHQNSRRRN